MTRPALWRIGALTPALLLIAGCAAAQPPYAELAEPQTDADLLPGVGDGSVIPESVRLVGEHDGRSYFLAQSTATLFRDGVCVLVQAPDVEGFSCGEHEVTIDYPFGVVRYDRTPMPDSALEDDWVRISHNVVLQPTS